LAPDIISISAGKARGGALYQRGIEIEPLAEPFYQSLMRACLALRRFAEGLEVHERCRKLLAAELRVAPSPETEALAKRMREVSP